MYSFITFIVGIGVFISLGYYGRKANLKRIEQIELQMDQQAEITRKILEKIERDGIVYNKGNFVI